MESPLQFVCSFRHGSVFSGILLKTSAPFWWSWFSSWLCCNKVTCSRYLDFNLKWLFSWVARTSGELPPSETYEMLKTIQPELIVRQPRGDRTSFSFFRLFYLLLRWKCAYSISCFPIYPDGGDKGNMLYFLTARVCPVVRLYPNGKVHSQSPVCGVVSQVSKFQLRSCNEKRISRWRFAGCFFFIYVSLASFLNGWRESYFLI